VERVSGGAALRGAQRLGSISGGRHTAATLARYEALFRDEVEIEARTIGKSISPHIIA